MQESTASVVDEILTIRREAQELKRQRDELDGRLRKLFAKIEQINNIRSPGQQRDELNPLRRSRIIRSVRISFFLGAALACGMIPALYWGGIWIGALFIPPLIGAYGLFLSSGKQLDEIDSAGQDGAELGSMQAG